MAKKTLKPIKKNSKTLTESHFAVLLEDIDSNVKLMAEGQDMLRRDLGSFKKETNQRFDSLETEMRQGFSSVWQEMGLIKQEVGSAKQEIGSTKQEMGSIKQEMGSMKQEMGSMKEEISSMKQEMSANFKTIREYLSRIDDELQEIKAELKNKADKKDFIILEQRVTRLEIELGQCRAQIAVAKK